MLQARDLGFRVSGRNWSFAGVNFIATLPHAQRLRAHSEKPVGVAVGDGVQRMCTASIRSAHNQSSGPYLLDTVVPPRHRDEELTQDESDAALA